MGAIVKIVLHDDQNNKKQVCASLEDFYHQKV
jgi:pyruvate,water dikinase